MFGMTHGRGVLGGFGGGRRSEFDWSGDSARRPRPDDRYAEGCQRDRDPEGTIDRHHFMCGCARPPHPVDGDPGSLRPRLPRDPGSDEAHVTGSGR